MLSYHKWWTMVDVTARQSTAPLNNPNWIVYEDNLLLSVHLVHFNLKYPIESNKLNKLCVFSATV